MTVRWEKLGRVFVPSGEDWWALSHASTPTVSWNLDGTLRVYFSARDEGGRSHIGSVVLAPDQGFRVIEVDHEPVLSPGQLGLFDDSGVAVGSVVHWRGAELLYYMGWNLRVTVPWANSIGLALRSSTDDPFVRVGRVPVMDRSEEDPFTLSYPWVVSAGDSLTMWYGTNTAWGATADDMKHVVRRATSSDGMTWVRDPHPCLDLIHDGEYAISRPCVHQESPQLEMLYSYRSHVAPTSYRLGRAASSDGLVWQRMDDNMGIEPTSGDWDGEMICYPCVFEWNDETWLLYNGDGYGRTGFGLARRVRST
ncbi:MAG: hypothetical protein ABI894_15935 [Ilumatobacteraceae bacterium]